MPQFPSVIELSGLNGSTGFQINGVAAADYNGLSVSSAGDINGDGFDDLIIGARKSDTNGSEAGDSYVVYGKASGFSSVLELSALNGTNGFKISGEAASDHSGVSVASAGDVNGDGFADLIIGAYDASINGLSSGSTYVVFGKASSFGATLNLSTLDGTTGFQINGEAAGDFSGGSVASAGDINGDGFADLIIGAYGADPNGATSGATYVVFGKASGFTANLNLSSLTGTNGFQINGAAADDIAGFSVASAGDINGDGYADLVIGAPFADPNGDRSGASYVVFGKASAFSATLELSALTGSNGFKINGVTPVDWAGWSVASAGDVNSDGYADIIIGARNADPNGSYSGASYVVFGKSSGFGATLELSGLNGTTGFKINGVAAGDSSGVSVASAGDVNGDGFDDLIVGAQDADPNGALSGSSYVVFGKASGFGATIELSSLTGVNGFKINGEAAGDISGVSVSSAGDINGDGFADLVIGAMDADPNGSYSGASYVVFGRMPDAAVNRTGTNAAQTLAGGNFDDILSGLGGNDRIFGYGGDDTLSGGFGSDIFMFMSGTDISSVGDHITDFESEIDHLDVSRLGLTFIGTGAFTGVAGQTRYAFSGATTILSIDSNGDSVADKRITIDSGRFDFSMSSGVLTGLGVTTPVRGDFNADLKSDLVWRNTDGTVLVWQMNGPSITQEGNLGAVSAAWTVAGIGDFNGNSKSDILWRHTDGSVLMWQMNGTSIAAESSLGQVTSSWVIEGIGDFDGDINSDILWRHTDGSVLVWRMNGLTIASEGSLGVIGSSWNMVAKGDFSGDGKTDVLWRHTDGSLILWNMNGTSIGSEGSMGQIGTSWNIVATGDFDGSGKADLLWRNTDGSLIMWKMNGTQIISESSLGVIGTSWKVVGTGDYNGDRKADIMWRHTDGTTLLWNMNGATIASEAIIGQMGNSWVINPTANILAMVS